MDNHEETIKVSHDQHAELMKSVRDLVSSIHAIRSTADHTDLPAWQKGVKWFGVCIFLTNALGSLGVIFIWLWLNANFVSIDLNDRTWREENAQNKEQRLQQIKINTDMLQQLSDLNGAGRVNAEVNSHQNASLQRLENETGELRRLLMKQ